MREKSEGAWIIHHAEKLKESAFFFDYDSIRLAGQCGTFLSNLSSDEESTISKEKVEAIARISQIGRNQIEEISDKLAKENLIDCSKNGEIAVLGITNSNILMHTSSIFLKSNPSEKEIACLELAEKTSDRPLLGKDIREYLSDTYKLSNEVTDSVLTDSEEIGFIDSEKLEDDSKLFFNGNLFRRDNLTKTNAVLSSFSKEEAAKISTLNATIENLGCVDFESAINIIGEKLLQKLQSIGMYDFNEVSNAKGKTIFLTKPSSFSKHGNPFEDDALDLAKAFVASLFYGMHYSESNRGRIQSLDLLVKKLISGREIGPATAIGEDYKILELKRVIQIRPEGNLYYMKLLKREVGELALLVLKEGNTAEKVTSAAINSSSISNYTGPEKLRYKERRKSKKSSEHELKNIINSLRTS